MKVNRREFLKITGGAVVSGFVAKSMADAVLNSNFIEALPAEKGDIGSKRWGMVIDVSKCTECMESLISETGNPNVKPPCVVACDEWNNVPEFEDKKIDPQWIRIAKFKFKTSDIEGSKEFYMPLLCNHCEYPPCVQVCPTHASFKRKDGIVVIDEHRCIGCRYCIIACPYGSRSFNFTDPREGLKKVNPSVPTREHGVVEKCNFCVRRVDEALARGETPEPACVEACRKQGKNALIFGNIKDRNSKIYKIVSQGNVIRLRAYLGTEPHVFYWHM